MFIKSLQVRWSNHQCKCIHAYAVTSGKPIVANYSDPNCAFRYFYSSPKIFRQYVLNYLSFV